MNNIVKIAVTALFLMVQVIATTGCADLKEGDGHSPILLLATNEHFGTYTGQILLAEGFNEYEVDSIGGANVDETFLQQFNVVILAQPAVTDPQRQLLENYVEKGGCLIAFRPDKKLAPLFGLAEPTGTLDEGYISIGAVPGLCEGLSTETLQFHGTADRYAVETAATVASLYKDANTKTGFPAVVRNERGEGRAFAFLYNLPESIVLTRQGNRDDAGKEMDGITGIRAMDLFTGGWVDTAKNTINQADEHMHLLSRCIEDSYADVGPLPRFWYFPDSLQCLVTLNNDGEDSKEEEFTPQFEDVDAKGAKMTFYIKETALVSKEWVDRWISKGFEIAAHPDDTKQATAPDWNTMDSIIGDIKQQLKIKYGIPEIHTNTNHWFVWVGKQPDAKQDFAALAKIEEQHNIGLDCNYAHYDNGSNGGHFLGAMGTKQGNYTGSGLAMKFADAAGNIVNVYQQLNNVYDQQYMENKDPDGYFNAFKGLMDRSLENDVYSFISVKAHNNEYFFSKVPLMKMLDYANSKQVPVWTEVKLLEFLKAKDEATFTDIRWENNELKFTIHSSVAHSHGITFMVPGSFNGNKIKSISSKNISRPIRVKAMKGREYAMVTVQAGSDHEFQVSYLQ